MSTVQKGTTTSAEPRRVLLSFQVGDTTCMHRVCGDVHSCMCVFYVLRATCGVACVQIEIQPLSQLLALDLSNNRLSGPLPGNVRLDILGTLEMSGNRLTGTIPASFEVNSMMSRLDLSKNLLRCV